MQPNPTCVMTSMDTTKVHTHVHITGHCALLLCDDGGGHGEKKEERRAHERSAERPERVLFFRRQLPISIDLVFKLPGRQQESGRECVILLHQLVPVLEARPGPDDLERAYLAALAWRCKLRANEVSGWMQQRRSQKFSRAGSYIPQTRRARGPGAPQPVAAPAGRLRKLDCAGVRGPSPSSERRAQNAERRAPDPLVPPVTPPHTGPACLWVRVVLCAAHPAPPTHLLVAGVRYVHISWASGEGRCQLQGP